MITVNIGFENNIDFDDKSDIIDTQDETQFFDPCKKLYIETV